LYCIWCVINNKQIKQKEGNMEYHTIFEQYCCNGDLKSAKSVYSEHYTPTYNDNGDIAMFSRIFCVCCDSNHIDVIQWLLLIAKDKIDRQCYNTGFKSACEHGYYELVCWLHSNNKYTINISTINEAFVTCCEQSNLALVQYLYHNDKHRLYPDPINSGFRHLYKCCDINFVQIVYEEQQHRIEIYTVIDMYVSCQNIYTDMKIWLSTVIPKCVLDDLNGINNVINNGINSSKTMRDIKQITITGSDFNTIFTHKQFIKFVDDMNDKEYFYYMDSAYYLLPTRRKQDTVAFMYVTIPNDATVCIDAGMFRSDKIILNCEPQLICQHDNMCLRLLRQSAFQLLNIPHSDTRKRILDIYLTECQYPEVECQRIIEHTLSPKWQQFYNYF